MIEKQWQVVPFSGSSMNPTLKAVDAVWVDFSKKDPPQLGEVLLYRDEDLEWVCHRLIFKEKDQYVLMGDMSLNATLISNKDAWGIVRAARRQKTILFFVQTPLMKGICYFQHRQTKSVNFFAKKFYRFLSKIFLYLNRWFSIRSLNHKASYKKLSRADSLSKCFKSKY